MTKLEELAVKYGTDKLQHGYLPHYMKHFPDRKANFTLLELGVFAGASLRMWREYYPNAKIYGVDIEKNRYQNDISEYVFIGDCTDETFLKDLLGKIGPVDIVIDDASHISKQQITTFELLWPLIESGGIYVCEDLNTSYLPEFAGGYNAVEYFNQLIEPLHTYEDKHSIDEVIYSTELLMVKKNKKTTMRKKEGPMNIVIGIPTGGRAEQAVEVARSWTKKGIRVFITTWDEKTEEAFLEAKMDNVEIMKVKSMLSFAANQNMMMAMNDWDVWICGADDLWSGGQYDLKDRIEIVAEEAGNRLIWVADGCLNQQPTHPIITRGMYEAEGPKVLCEDYRHNFVDTDLFARMLQKGMVVKCFDINLDHRHPINGGAMQDEIYNIGGKSYPEDAIMYHDRWGKSRITINSVEEVQIEEAITN